MIIRRREQLQKQLPNFGQKFLGQLATLAAERNLLNGFVGARLNFL
jgi:hypothetical protein